MSARDYDRWTELSDAQAVGQALAEDDERFLRDFAETDPLALAETRLFQSLEDSVAELEPLLDELGNRRLADAAVRAALAQGPVRRRPGSPLRWVVGGLGLAVAAAAAVVAVHRSPGASGTSVVEYVASGVTVSGVSASMGFHVAEGADVVAAGGPACVAVEPTIHICLASGAKVRLSKVGTKERRIDLLAGRVAVALAPLPVGERFSVVAGRVWSTAVGTAFTVEQRDDGSVETIVHEGKVAVGAEQGAHIAGAHKIGLSNDTSTSIESLTSHERTETPEWAALAAVAHRSIEALPLPVASTPAPSPAVEAPAALETPKIDPAATPLPGRTSPRSQTAEPAEPDTAATLLSSARQALREQRWSDAASAYRKLVAAFPGAPEAHTVLVPLANLEITRLGQPSAALDHLNSYLASGGALEMEARLAKIRAFRGLGQAADEARAIDEFLAAHPSAMEAAKLRERRDELGPR